MAHNAEGDITPESHTAPWYSIQPKQIVTVEHPCLIKNIEKGIQTLGGFTELSQMLKEKGANPISLFLKPQDPASRPLISTNRLTDNVLLKITVPRRTGRKRKRGSDDRWTEDSASRRASPGVEHLLQSLRDNQESSTVQAVGTIIASQTFRTMPDFVYSTSDSTFMNHMREKILPFQYPLMKEWKLDMSRGKTDTEILPPPTLSTQQIPGNYGYRQNPAVQASFDPSTGKNVLFNAQKAQPIYTLQVPCEAPEMPTQPDPSAPPLHTLGDDFQSMARDLEEIFSKRPIWTRRGMFNQLPPRANIFLARQAVSYVAYVLRSGPFRDCYIKLGVDPTSDPKYAVYQSLMLQLNTRSKSKAAQRARFKDRKGKDPRPDPNSHIFNGRPPIYDDAKAWQLCDMTDPLLAGLVHNSPLRPHCERRYFGWYKNGTYSKIKIIFRAKMDMLIDSDEQQGQQDQLQAQPQPQTQPQPPPPSLEQQQSQSEPQPLPPPPSEDDSIFTSLLRFPDEVRGDDHQDPMTHLPENASSRELMWATLYRSICRAPEGAVPTSGRLTKSRPVMRAGFLGPGDKGDEEDEDEEEEEEEGEGEEAGPSGGGGGVGQRKNTAATSSTSDEEDEVDDDDIADEGEGGNDDEVDYEEDLATQFSSFAGEEEEEDDEVDDAEDEPEMGLEEEIDTSGADSESSDDDDEMGEAIRKEPRSNR
ncbi:MAG: hypothetical protein Q9160_007595 [Pyrenula sp. 1 TL-2023]